MPANHQTSVQAAPDINQPNSSSPEIKSRLNEAATIAYYKAASRYFAPGKELDEWLEAVSKINNSGELRP